jgi:hypothetical protein
LASFSGKRLDFIKPILFRQRCRRPRIQPDFMPLVISAAYDVGGGRPPMWVTDLFHYQPPTFLSRRKSINIIHPVLIIINKFCKNYVIYIQESEKSMSAPLHSGMPISGCPENRGGAKAPFHGYPSKQPQSPQGQPSRPPAQKRNGGTRSMRHKALSSPP